MIEEKWVDDSVCEICHNKFYISERIMDLLHEYPPDICGCKICQELWDQLMHVEFEEDMPSLSNTIELHKRVCKGVDLK